ncbi:phage tail tape measure protein [Azotobacter vinelandii]
MLNTLIDKGLDGYREVEAKMKAQADLRKRVDDQLKTLTNVIDAAQGSWTNAMAEFGAAVAPELKGLIQWLGNVASGIGAWAREKSATGRDAGQGDSRHRGSGGGWWCAGHRHGRVDRAVRHGQARPQRLRHPGR